MTEGRDVRHSMKRRSAAHDYSRPGIYHITTHVAKEMGRPLGMVVGGDAATAAVALTAAGRAVEHELLTAISAHYPMIAVDAYVVMPEHLHFILIVRAPIVSGSGRPTHLGQVIAGFKQGCNRAYWDITGQREGNLAAKPQDALAAKPQGTVEAKAQAAGGAAKPQGTVEGKAQGTVDTVLGGSAAKKARFDTGRKPLFEPGYCDVMPIEPGQLDTMRSYIGNNPRSRWLRTHNPAMLQPRRDGIDTALSFSALRGYLRRECPRHLVADEALTQIEGRLLMAGNIIACHTYGDRGLLQRRRLPVVCHRRDKRLFEQQKARCLEEAAQGALLVSPRIAKGEQAIIDEAESRGYAVALIADNGFPEVYHPSETRIARCSEGRLLILTPWQYQYRGKHEEITVPFCKTMNCVAQAICRLKDDWWKTLAIEH